MSIDFSCVDKLVDIGLNKYEALAYIALLERKKATAIDVANRSGVPKQRVYDVLDNLQTKGLCSVQEGRPRCYIAHQPQQALPAVLNYQKQRQAAENERQARLIEELIPSLTLEINRNNGEASPSSHADGDVKVNRDIGGF